MMSRLGLLACLILLGGWLSVGNAQEPTKTPEAEVKEPIETSEVTAETLSKIVAGLLADTKTPNDLRGDFRLLIYGRERSSERQDTEDQRRQSELINTMGDVERRLLVLHDTSRSSPNQFHRERGLTLTLYRIGEDITTMKYIALDGFDALRPSDGRRFEAILVGLDGGVKERWDRYVTQEDLFAAIDAMPMRQSELNKRQ